MKTLLALGVVLFTAISVSAQGSEAKAEVGFTYTYVRNNSTGTRTVVDPRLSVNPLIVGGQSTVTFSIPAFSANGGTGSFAYNFSDQFAGVFEFSGVHNGNISGFHLDNTWYTYLFGPRFSVTKRSHKFVPSFHALFGGVHRSDSVFLPPVTVNGVSFAGVGLSGSQSGFSMALGGTLDINVSRHVALRPVQLDYLLTRVSSTSLGGFDDFNHNNLRYQGGLVFRFGNK